MSYQYYQQSGTPGWGTSQFRFGAPPAPNYQPQPTWNGMDYYRAHAASANADPSLFDNAWNSVRDYRDPYSQGDSMGVGVHEARHWHRRAYGGMGELSQMSPAEIGNAAAYEAYRTWIYNTSVSEPLSGDMERQREALIGMAVAEASRLLQYSQHANYGRMEASTAAAMTASTIFYWSREHDDGDSFRGRARSRGNSFSDYDDAYAGDYDRMYSGHHRSHSHHHRSHSRHRSRSRPPPGMVGSLSGLTGTSPMQGMMPGEMPGAMHGMGMAGSMAGSMAGTMPGAISGTMPGAMSGGYGASPSAGYPSPYGTPYSGTMQYGMQPQSALAGQYTPGYASTTAGYTPTSALSPSYAGSGMIDPYQRHRSTAIAPYGQQVQYPQTQYVQQAQYVQQPQYAQQQYYVQPGTQYLPQQTVLMSQPHRHRHKSKSRRSKSTDPHYLEY